MMANGPPCIFRILGPRRSAFGLAFPAAEAQAAFNRLRSANSRPSIGYIQSHMPKTRQHHYRLTIRWTGNLGRGTAAYTAYSRNHELMGAEKSAPIFGSSDPAFQGDPARYNPEELLVGALAACHMLWVLHLCADAGIVITEYEDATEGEMIEREDGSGHFTRVVLRPRMLITDARGSPMPLPSTRKRITFARWRSR
jgi:organic hydroperoxide reductase OsmC/OhrA